jgi:hypothetical protein
MKKSLHALSILLIAAGLGAWATSVSGQTITGAVGGNDDLSVQDVLRTRITGTIRAADVQAVGYSNQLSGSGYGVVDISDALRSRAQSSTALVAAGVRLHFQIIEAGSEEVPSDPAIARIESVLRDVFRFRGYRLIGESIVTASDGADIRQKVAGPGEYSISGDLGKIELRENGTLTAPLSVTLWIGTRDAPLRTTVNLMDRQTLVLGTAGGESPAGAIILTVTPTFQR